MVCRISLGIWLTIWKVSLVLSSSDCNYKYTLRNEEVFHIQNDEYPQNYVGGSRCQWTINSEPGTKIALDCTEFELPESENCDDDKLSVSVSGDPTLMNSIHQCGQETISMISNSNSMVVGFSAVDESLGGKFHCTMEVVKNVTQPRLAAASCDCGWRLSSQNQRLYSKMSEESTKPKLKIVGGYETGQHEFPAVVGMVDLQQQELYCGGAIISNYYVLTAAHCLNRKSASSIACLVGGHDIDNLDQEAVIHRVYAYEMHPNFSGTDQYDIGIVRVLEPIQFTNYVGPVCLPFRYVNERFAGQPVIAAGWGAVEFSGALSRVLREVPLSVIPNSQCAQQQGSTVINSQMCTYTRGKDTCQGDSGGPLFWFNTNIQRLILVGIVSSGEGCAGTKPGISTFVSSFLQWIVNRTSDASYCVF